MNIRAIVIKHDKASAVVLVEDGSFARIAPIAQGVLRIENFDARIEQSFSDLESFAAYADSLSDSSIKDEQPASDVSNDMVFRALQWCVPFTHRRDFAVKVFDAVGWPADRLNRLIGSATRVFADKKEAFEEAPSCLSPTM